MADKELQKMNRAELIEIIYALQQNERSLRSENEKLSSQLDERLLRMEKAGSIAEAALSLNHIFEDAQMAAQQYLDSVKSAEADAAQIISDARRRAKEMIYSAEERARRADEECQAIWDQLEQDIQKRKAFFTRSSRRSPETYSGRTAPLQEDNDHMEMADDERKYRAQTDVEPENPDVREDIESAVDERRRRTDSDVAVDKKKRRTESDAAADEKKRRAESDVTVEKRRRRTDSDVTVEKRKRRIDSDVTPEKRKRRTDSEVTVDKWKRRVNPDVMTDERRRPADSDTELDDWDRLPDTDTDADDWDRLPDEEEM